MFQFIQTLVDGLTQGSFYGLLAVGFGLIFGVSGRFHFAYATTFIVPVYTATSFISAGAPLYVGIVSGIICGTVLGCLIEWFLYRPLVKRSPTAALLAVFVTSLGIVIVGENVIALVWGAGQRPLGTGFAVTRLDLVAGAAITTLDAVVIGVCVVIIGALWVYLGHSTYGRAIRAVKENPVMARVVGINPGRAILVVFAMGSAVSAVGGVLYTMQFTATPDAGVTPTFTALVVIFLAGVARSSPLRFGLIGLALGILEAFTSLWINGEWSPVVTFGILFVYIALTPTFANYPLGAVIGRLRRATPQA